MKTREVIRLLQEADPSGELEAVVGCDDIFFIHQEEAYYDGTPALLVRDPKKAGYYDVVGLHLPASGGPNKVRIHTLGAEGVLLSDPDAPVTYGDDDARRYNEERVEAKRAEVKKVIAESDKQGRP